MVLILQIGVVIKVYINHPSPYYECIQFKYNQHKFGFIDLNQYQNWFNEKWRIKFKKNIILN